MQIDATDQLLSVGVVGSVGRWPDQCNRHITDHVEEPRASPADTPTDPHSVHVLVLRWYSVRVQVPPFSAL